MEVQFGVADFFEIETKELQDAVKHFLEVFKLSEHHLQSLLSGKTEGKYAVGDGQASDPRREMYAEVYETFRKSQDPFDHILFQTLELNFPKPEQVHLTPHLLPPQE
ncbi:MAG: hypothetical protein AAF378_00975 [Cyanobacteria bacterium P01_A01_bin.84]